MLKLSQENQIIDLPDLNRFQIGDHVVVEASADNDLFEGVIIGIELRRMYGLNHLVPSITILHDGCITDEFRPIDCRKVTPTPQPSVALPQDVIDLVVAAREALQYLYGLDGCELRSLDDAVEAFSERVPYENEPATTEGKDNG